MFFRKPRPSAARLVFAVLAAAAVALFVHGCSKTQPTQSVVETPSLQPQLTPLFDDLERRTFDYFWTTAEASNGLIPDRYPYTEPFSSIAAIGFGLTAYG